MENQKENQKGSKQEIKNPNHSRAVGILKPQIGLLSPIAVELRGLKPNLSNQKNENRIFLHLLKHQKKYFLLLALLVLGLPLLFNLAQHKPLLMSGESYFFLMEKGKLGYEKLSHETLSYGYLTLYENIAFLPFSLLNTFLPEGAEGGITLIPLLIALLSITLLIKLARRWKLPDKFTFFFLLFFILSPAFIWSYTNLSFYSYYLLLLLFGFFLMEQKRKEWHYPSLLFFIMGTFFDIFSSLMAILLLGFYFFLFRKARKEQIKKGQTQKEQTRPKQNYFQNLFRPQNYFPLASLAIVGFFVCFNAVMLEQPFILGPFYPPEHLPDLISDLGGLSGIGFFTLLLAFIGLLVTWRRKNSYPAYFFLLFLAAAYFLNPNVILLFSLLAAFFAAAGFLKLLEGEWSLEILKTFTLLILILGFTFSAVSYLDRVNENGPTKEDLKAYAFLKRESLSDSIIFTAPENSYYIKYYTGREAFYYPHSYPYSYSSDKQKKNISQSILSAAYVDQLFPLLEENRIALLYLTPKMQAGLPKDYGLLFLLKNERLILLYASEGYEVWQFKEE